MEYNSGIRVLRLTPFFDWPSIGGSSGPSSYNAVGGLAIQAGRQSLALSRLGVEQTVLTLSIPGFPAEMAVDERIVVRGVRSPSPSIASRAPGGMGPYLEWGLGVRASLRERPASYDLIHVHGTGAPWPLWSALSVQRTLALPLVVTIHCSIVGTYQPANWRDAAFQHLARRAERLVIKRAARTIVLTERVGDILRAGRGARPERISLVPDSLDVELFRRLATEAATADFRERYGLPRDRPIVVYVGRVSHEKGWPALVVLAEQLAGRAHLLVCGGGPDEPAFRQEVARRGLDEHVTVTGFVPQEKVAAALACSSVIVLTSNFEEFGSALVEGMAMSLPAVGFAVGGVPEAIADGETGFLVPPGDTRALAAATLRLLDDVELAQIFGARALEVSRDRFDLAENAARIRDFYEAAAT